MFRNPTVPLINPIPLILSVYIRRYLDSEGIISNPTVFDLDYLPEEMPFREGELDAMAREVAFFVKKGAPTNLFLWGPPGTGKTASVRKILRESEAVFPGVRTAYVNVWNFRTRTGILTEIARQIGIPIPVSGVSYEFIYSSLLERLDGKVIIALDEADRLLGNTDILYDLSRMGSRAMLITIANSKEFLTLLDARIISTLFQNEVEYKPYTVPQLTEILRRRAENGLYPNTWDDKILRICAAVGFSRGGDARIAITCLYNAAKHAEGRGASRIMEEDVKAVKGELSYRRDIDPKFLPIVELLSKNGPMTTGDLYREYSKSYPINERTFRNYIRELADRGIVEVKRLKKKGNVRLVQLRG